MKSQNGIMLLHLVCYWPNFHVNIKFYAVCYYADISKCCLRCFSFTFYLFVCVCVFLGVGGKEDSCITSIWTGFKNSACFFWAPNLLLSHRPPIWCIYPSETNCLKYWAVSVIFLHLDLFVFLVYNEYINLYVAVFYLFHYC